MAGAFKIIIIIIMHVGLVYAYLAGHVGRLGEEGAFSALARGYTHWASGWLQELQVNTNNQFFCHVQCTTSPSMKFICCLEKKEI